MALMALVVMLAYSSHAFSPILPATHHHSTATTTTLGLFGFFDKEKEEAAPKVSKTAFNAKSAKNTKAKEEAKKKEPFIFLYGKPQYDWVKGKPMENRKGIGEFSWYTKPTTSPPKKKN